MQDLLGGVVRRPDAKEALALGIQSRVEKAQAQVKPTKFKCHVCAEQMHANTPLQVPGDGSNELRVGLDWERRGLEPDLGYLVPGTCTFHAPWDFQLLPWA